MRVHVTEKALVWLSMALLGLTLEIQLTMPNFWILKKASWRRQSTAVSGHRYPGYTSTQHKIHVCLPITPVSQSCFQNVFCFRATCTVDPLVFMTQVKYIKCSAAWQMCIKGGSIFLTADYYIFLIILQQQQLQWATTFSIILSRTSRTKIGPSAPLRTM